MMTSRRFVRYPVLVLLAAAALPLAAARRPPTAPGRYESWGPDIDSIEIIRPLVLSDYAKVVVEPLDVSATPRAAERDMVPVVERVLASPDRPFLRGLSDGIGRWLPVVPAPGGDLGRALIVRGRVLKMEPGSRAKRVWVGYGAGAAHAAVQIELVDGASGQVLVRFTQERLSGYERFGRSSSYEEIMMRNLRTLGEDTANVLRVF